MFFSFSVGFFIRWKVPFFFQEPLGSRKPPYDIFLGHTLNTLNTLKYHEHSSRLSTALVITAKKFKKSEI